MPSGRRRGSCPGARLDSLDSLDSRGEAAMLVQLEGAACLALMFPWPRRIFAWSTLQFNNTCTLTLLHGSPGPATPRRKP